MVWIQSGLLLAFPSLGWDLQGSRRFYNGVFLLRFFCRGMLPYPLYLLAEAYPAEEAGRQFGQRQPELLTPISGGRSPIRHLGTLPHSGC